MNYVSSKKRARSLRSFCVRISAFLLAKLKVGIFSIRYPDAIGHISLDPCCCFFEKKLKHFDFKRIIMLVSYAKSKDGKNINKSLINYWRKHFIVVTSPKLCRFFSHVYEDPRVKIDIENYTMNVNDTARVFELFSKWGDQKILTLKRRHQKNGESVLRKLGLPKNAWFVVFSARCDVESAYCPELFYRNSDIDSYYLALQEIRDRGGWCIRVGTRKTKPLSKQLMQLGNVIDYPHTKYASNRMDLFLCANAVFHLCNSSGIYSVSTLFGVPNVIVNIAPQIGRGMTRNDLLIYKLSEKEKKLMKFSELLNSENRGLYTSTGYKEKGITLINNSPEEIRDAVIEMFRIQNNDIEYTEEDERLQSKFSEIYHQGIYGHKSESRAGAAFLQKYKSLL